jgi:hypothetical protein
LLLDNAFKCLITHFSIAAEVTSSPEEFSSLYPESESDTNDFMGTLIWKNNVALEYDTVLTNATVHSVAHKV